MIVARNVNVLFRSSRYTSPQWHRFTSFVTSRDSSSSSNNSVGYRAVNEPVLEYARGSRERDTLTSTLQGMLSQKPEDREGGALFDVPIVIGDRELRPANAAQYQLVPFDHRVKLARFYHADEATVRAAITSCLEARATWESAPADHRAAVLLRAADTLAGASRSQIIAATMLGQGKTIFQAEIDAVCELVDFFRFNVQFAHDNAQYQPLDATHTHNRMEMRALDGFVAAIAPFNFTAIGANLSTAPALMGNTVVWKPSDTAVLSSYVVYKALREAGLPPGVINFVPADGPVFGQTITRSSDLAAINFTGSVATFRWLWKQVGARLEDYKNFPRLSGECGGKNFHLIHESADLDSAALATVRSAFEYSGQKCSACSRLYVPKSKWPRVREQMLTVLAELKVGSPIDFATFMSSVIDEKSFDRISAYISHGKQSANCRLVYGGGVDKSKGYFVEPTIFETSDPHEKLMREEIFGPVLTVYVYNDADYAKMPSLIDTTTPYALTGSIFAQDEQILASTMQQLRHSCGNMYINDKSTGAVVNQQPFGGDRLSGTNDKAGSPYYLLKWTSPISVKRFDVAQPSAKHASML